MKKQKCTYTTRKLRMGITPQLQHLAAESGRVYTWLLVHQRRVLRKKGIFLGDSAMEAWLAADVKHHLHSHTIDAIIRQLHEAWYTHRRSRGASAAPHRRKRFNQVTWKSAAIRVKNGVLRLSNGGGMGSRGGRKLNPPLEIPWEHDVPHRVDLIWTGKEYELRILYRVEIPPHHEGGRVAGLDPGETHLGVAHDGEEAFSVSGRFLRSLYRYRYHLKVRLQAMLERKQRGSRRHRRLARSLAAQLQKLSRQIREVLHQQSRAMVAALQARGVTTVAIGDCVSGRRPGRKVFNGQALEFSKMVAYKATQARIKVVSVDERGTTYTCPECGNKLKAATNRSLYCPVCDFRGHRDITAAINIRRRYLGSEDPSPVVGAMGAPTGIRFIPGRRSSLRREMAPADPQTAFASFGL